MTPGDLHRARELADAATQWQASTDCTDGHLVADNLAADILGCVPALLDEVERLRAELGHATAHDGDWLSKTSRAMCETILGERDALRIEVERLRARQDELLAAMVRITNETPYPDEINGWTEQRAKLIAEVGTLRAEVADLRDRLSDRPRGSDRG